MATRLVGAAAAALGFLLATGPASAASIAVFDDGAYVDTSNNSEAESDTIQASLISLGHTVNPFTGISAAAFTSGLAGNAVLWIPEIENGDLGADLDAAAIAVVSAFVSGGGGLVINGGSNFEENSATSFLNAVFGFSLDNSDSGVSGSSDLNAAGAAGTPFAGGPASLPNVGATHPLTTALPAGGLSIYDDQGGTGGSTVALIPFGAGSIVYLGWDWFEAQPLGSEDDGWLDVANRAVAAVTDGQVPSIPEPAVLPLFLLGVAGLGLMRRRLGTA